MTSLDRRTRERLLLQEKILDAAREQFLAGGYEAVSLRKIAEAEPSSLGDPSTLADPSVVDDLVGNRQNKHQKDKVS